MKTFFIYRYVRNDTNMPFYIGKGTRRDFDRQGYPHKSIKARYWRAYEKTRNHICLGIMNKTSYDVDILYESNDLNHIEEKEREFIKLYGNIYDNSGTLVNLTYGGEECLVRNNFFTKKHVEKRHSNGTYFGINRKPVYMYD